MLGWVGTVPMPLPEADVQCALECPLLKKDSSCQRLYGSTVVVIRGTGVLVSTYISGICFVSVSLELTQVVATSKKGTDTSV